MKPLTLEEKIRLTSGQANWHFFASDQLKTPKFVVADGPHGLRVYKDNVQSENILDTDNVQKATLFPSASLMASTWNVDALETVGSTIEKEARYYHIDGVLGPGVNLKRSPLGGRNFEYYSEDPYLTAEMASAFVKGIQKNGVKACLKHFATNEQETMRRFVNTMVDERTLHELYLYPFKKVIETASPGMIMSAYNKVNGTYASESKQLLKDILREKWHYEGVVISDWGAVQDKVKSIKNGMNVEMPGPSSFNEDIKVALKDGSLLETDLDESLKPVFKMINTHNVTPLTDIDFDAHHKIAKDISDQGMVLLENDGTLPLNKSRKIALIGQFAETPRINGGGSATVRPYRVETPLAAISNAFDTVFYAKGYNDLETSESLLEKVDEAIRQSDVVVFLTGTTESIETEGKDRSDLNLPTAHSEVLNRIKQHHKPLVTVLNNGSALDLRTVKKASNACLESWFLGSAGALSMADILVGKVNPSGRLQETFPLKLAHTPHYQTFPQSINIDYHSDLLKVGYQYYNAHDLDVLYPFGYGLSYAKIDFESIDIEQTQSSVQVSVTLTNKSAIDGHEVIQLYVKHLNQDTVHPFHALKGFKKVLVKANSDCKVELSLDYTAFEMYDIHTHTHQIFNGEYTVQVAKNAKAILKEKTIKLTTHTPYKIPLDLSYPYNFFQLYYPHITDSIETNFRPLQWYEKEEPMHRILKRYKKNKSLSNETYKQIVKTIKEAIKNV